MRAKNKYEVRVTVSGFTPEDKKIDCTYQMSDFYEGMLAAMTSLEDKKKSPYKFIEKFEIKCDCLVSVVDMYFDLYEIKEDGVSLKKRTYRRCTL